MDVSSHQVTYHPRCSWQALRSSNPHSIALCVIVQDYLRRLCVDHAMRWAASTMSAINFVTGFVIVRYGYNAEHFTFYRDVSQVRLVGALAERRVVVCLDLCMCMCACQQEQFVRIMLFTGIAVALETCMFAAVSLYASKRGIQKGITSLLVPLAQLTRHHVCYSLFMWTFAAHGNRTCTQRPHSWKRSLNFTTSSPCFPSQSRLMRSQLDSSLEALPMASCAWPVTMSMSI